MLGYHATSLTGLFPTKPGKCDLMRGSTEPPYTPPPGASHPEQLQDMMVSSEEIMPPSPHQYAAY